MALSLWKTCNVTIKNGNLFSCGTIRYGHHLRGKPPGIAKSLEQKLAESKFKDPSLHFKVDIGLPPPRISRSKQLEELLINLEDTKEEWLKTAGSYHIKQIADHYGIFEHLFGDAYFYPRIPLKIIYETEDGKLPVYFGNTVKPSEATKLPEITYESGKKHYGL
ncbi:hypothetical protein NQ317_002795 [Molorchus minor]|uniref:39S ribosomal protein L50, mitochondrial n=1 Tax=Molorchus minor TaxID=1323400 RepID=A0ABQ9J834_9CUCU|nr:hypothetical protein NQ317_002795 [Molorchus minor]